MCNKAPYNPANIVICFPQNHNRKKNADQIEQFLFCRFLILPAVFPAVLTCDIPAGVLHHKPVREFVVHHAAAVIHAVTLYLHQPLQIRCRPGIIRLHPLPFPRFLLLLHTSSP